MVVSFLGCLKCSFEMFSLGFLNDLIEVPAAGYLVLAPSCSSYSTQELSHQQVEVYMFQVIYLDTFATPEISYSVAFAKNSQ